VDQDFFMDERTKSIITQHLAGISDRISDIEHVAGKDTRCVDVIWQIQTVQADLNNVRSKILGEYLETCVTAAAHDDDIAERERMLKELASVYGVSKMHNLLTEGDFKMIETKTFTVPNISCGHCTHTIERELGSMAGVARTTADQRTQQVTVVWEEPATWEKIDSRLREINYPPDGLIHLN
jgi:DNA-binding FrmR family transcriptional regulator/copper chaperone CopZ